MKILDNTNHIIDVDVTRHGFHYSVLSFKNFREPDFFFEPLTELELIECASASISIGGFSVTVPFPWCILATDYDMVECFPIVDLLGKKIPAFCLNPIDGYRVEFLNIKLTMIYPVGSFLIPALGTKDMLVVPLGYSDKKRLDKDGKETYVGPTCAIFSPTKLEINCSISDIFDS